MGVSEILVNQYGLDVRPGQKIECPFCHHKSFSIKRDDTIGKCFHPQCGRFITPFQSSAYYTRTPYKIFDQIYQELHAELLRRENTAYKYLVEERDIHPKVATDSMIGVVPENYYIRKKFEPLIDEIKAARDEKKGKDSGQRGRPKKKSFNPKEELENINLMIEKWKKAAQPGWLAFFYVDHLYRIKSIKFRKPYTKRILMFKPFKTSAAGLFGHQLFSPFRLPANIKKSNDYVQELEKRYEDLNSRLLVTEGEFNSLQLQSLIVKVAEKKNVPPYYQFVCSTGGAGNADYDCIKLIARQPIFCYDNDEAGLQMVENARNYMNVSAFTIHHSSLLDDEDLDAFIRLHNDDCLRAFEEVKQLLKNLEVFPRTYQSVAREIYYSRQMEKGDTRRQFEVFRDASLLLREDLKDRATFYHDEQDTYLFFELEKKLIRIHQDESEFQKLMARYGIMMSESISRFMIDYLQAEAFLNGKLTVVHQFAFYNKDTFCLYIYNNKNQIYRISQDQIELLDNGIDNVLFLEDPSAEPFELDLDSPSTDEKTSLLNEELTDKINFSEDVLTVDERRLLFHYYLLSLLFKSIQPTRVISCFFGAKGSGKSITLRKIGMLLSGSKFDVKSLPQNEDDFDVIAINSYLFFIDNADTKCSWLNDRLARAATGAEISKRELYTTAKVFKKRMQCFMGITSRTPHFRRDDVAERLLLMPVQRFKNIIPENVLLESILANRNAMLTELFRYAQQAIRALYRWKDVRESGSFRMADFYAFTVKLARSDGCEDKVINLFKKMNQEQSLFTLGHDVIFELLSEWVKQEADDGFGEKISNSRREVTSNILNIELADLAEKKGLGYPYREKPRAFAQRLSNLLSNLQEFFIISERKGRGKTKLYSFILREDEETAETVEKTIF